MNSAMVVPTKLAITRRCAELFGFSLYDIQLVLTLHDRWVAAHRSMSESVRVAELYEVDPTDAFQRYWCSELSFIERHSHLPAFMIIWILLEEAERAVALGKELNYAYERFACWVYGQTIFYPLGDA